MQPVGGRDSRLLITKEMRRQQFKKKYHSNSGTKNGDNMEVTAADSHSVAAESQINNKIDGEF